jgi:hypothetical protein
MARMIPDAAPITQSPGEEELFIKFRAEPGTADWVVLHSFDLPRHVRQVSGEADFVVLVPGKGVLVLEVKAVRSVRRENGVWYLGSMEHADARGPFKQASEAMHSLRELVASRVPAWRNLVFWSAVVFPYVSFPDRSPEWHDWQVIDEETLNRLSLKDAIISVLDRARAHLADVPSATWFDPTTARPTAVEIDGLTALLRPDFEMFETPRSRIRRLDQQIIRYTSEQFSALDAIQDNPRVVFDGAAGTGKTMLALEAARRASSLNRRVLLLCFNRALGRWLTEQMDGLSGVSAMTIHAHMLRVCGWSPSGNPDFWDRDLPSAACDAALEGKVQPWDQLVIDEGQDLLSPAMFDYLDLIVSGGLRRGQWQMFGDFAYQRIFRQGGPVLEHLLDERSIAPVRFRLAENCRNTPRIATYAGLLGGVTATYKHVLRPDDGVDPHTKFYSTREQQGDLLALVLDELAAEGFKGTDVAILSARGSDACIQQLPQAWSSRVCPADEPVAGRSRVSTIHAFKGLEAHAVVITDIETFDSALDRDLFYVGATRAFDRVTVLAHERTRVPLSSALLGAEATR